MSVAPSQHLAQGYGRTRRAVIGLLLLVVLLAVSMSGYLAYHEIDQQFNLARADALRYSREAAVGLDGFLLSTRRMLSSTSLDPAVRRQDPESTAQFVADLLADNPLYANIWATRLDGRNYASALPPPGNQQIHIGDREYFKQAIQSGQMSIQTIPDSRQLPISFAVVMALATRDGSGQVNGTVNAAFSLLPVQQILAETQLPPGSTLSVVDESGYIVAHHPSPEAWVGKKVDETALWNEVRAVHSGTLQMDGSLIGFTRTSVAPWNVMVTMPQANSYAIILNNLVRQILLVLAVSTTVFYLTWRFAQIALAERREVEVERLGLIDDVQRRAAELEVAALEAQRRAGELEAILESTQAQLALLDRDMTFILVNSAYVAGSGHTKEELIGHNHFSLFPNPENQRIFQQVRDTGERYEALEQPFEFADQPERGVTFWNWILAPIKNEAGNVEELLLSLLDVTSQVRARHQTERLLAAEQEARNEAEAAVRVRNEFISIAAHELKTPVTSLRGYAQLLARQHERTGTVELSRVLKAMAQVNYQSGRLARLTEQLLDISRIDSGKLSLTREETDLTDLVHGAVSSVRLAHQGRSFNFRDGLASRVCADPLRLEQVLVNLLDNAVKFSPKETPIDISIEKAGDSKVAISVRDYGDGVSQADRERIFERFYQAHGERSTGGMGIGLYVSRQIVEMHGGSITYEPAPGGGSIFVIRLPMARCPDRVDHIDGGMAR